MRYHKVSTKQKKKGGTNIMVSQVEVNLDMINIYLISSDFLKDKIFKFSDQQILRIMLLKEIKKLSLRGIVKELHSNEVY